MPEMSTLCSAAILRTSGVDLVRSRCSAVWTPPSPSVFITGAGAWELGTWARGAAGAGAGAGFGGSGFGAAGAGAGAAAAGFAAAAAASVSRTATSVWTGTVWPSCTLISASVPAAGAGISASTLSVEISNNGSSRFTVSPTFLSHLLKVPSAIDSPIWGIKTSTRAMSSPSVGRQPPGGINDIVRLGQHEVLECRRVRYGHVVRRHPHDRPVEPLERLLVDARRDLAGDPAGAGIFVHDQDFVGLLHRRHDGGIVHRQERPQVDHLDRQPVGLLERVRRLERLPHRGAVGDDRQVLPFPRRSRFTDRREDLFAFRQLVLDPAIQPLVLEIQHGVLIADRCLDEPLRVTHRRGIYDFQARRVQEG